MFVVGRWNKQMVLNGCMLIKKRMNSQNYLKKKGMKEQLKIEIKDMKNTLVQLFNYL